MYLHLHKELSIAAHNFKVPYFSGAMSHRWLEHYNSNFTTNAAICAQWYYRIGIKFYEYSTEGISPSWMRQRWAI